MAGKEQQAIVAYSKAIELNSKFVDAYMGRAASYVLVMDFSSKAETLANLDKANDDLETASSPLKHSYPGLRQNRSR